MYKYPCISIQMVIIVVFDQLSYFKRYYTFVLIILTICYIHPIDKTLSGEKHKSVMMQPNGALGSMNTCLYSWSRAHYNLACLNLLFKLSWEENILNFRKQNPVTILPVPSSQSSIVLHCLLFTHFTILRKQPRFCEVAT